MSVSLRDELNFIFQFSELENTSNFQFYIFNFKLFHMQWGEWKTEWGKNTARRLQAGGLWKRVGVSPFDVEKKR